ncbi:hypothetical protein F5B20DRAFT_572038 [Whalleya microplaca]|nr:hypothetical protein F5B20DRAFT_572038 [Whalleya microplaca]
MVYLATPHKGSQLAQTLNNILKTTPGASAKAYVAELEKNFNSLQDINEQFRNMCNDLKLVSFYETLKTNIGGGIRRLAYSALLGYPGEASCLSRADHHGIAKFKSPQDPNFTNVRNVLRWLVREIIEDLEFSSERYMQGSCQWLLQRQSFQDWVTNSPNVSNLLWITGTPGSGKSTLASFIINLLRTRVYAGTCQYHFVSGGSQTKRSISYLLRSIAFQAAMSSSLLYSCLLELHKGTGITFEQQKVSIIWEKIFEGVFCRMPSEEPFYWVIDGLDESESSSELIRLLSKIRSAGRINILLISRATKDLTKDINAMDIFDDIRNYVRQSIKRILPQDDAQEEIVHDIMSKASGSFLWVKLALDRIRDNWYTRDDIKTALNELPVGVESLYERMIEMIYQQSEKHRRMAPRILTWTTCAFYPLNIGELEVALKPEFKDFVNLGRMAEEICGQFVTARHFLLRKTSNLSISVQEHKGHEHAASVCIDFLSDSLKWRRVFTSIQMSYPSKDSISGRGVFDDHPFVYYALAFWTYHVSLASVDSDDFLAKVLGFLEDHCLLWIHGVALTRDLRVLTRAAKNLKTYVRRRTQRASKKPPTSIAMVRDGELRQWANDLIRVVGRFGTSIAESPTSIYKQVVPFCSKDSIIARTYASMDQLGFSVKGLSSHNWDDCLARLSLGDDQVAAQILCKDNLFITLLAIGGVMVVWRAETCEEVRRITHGEYVTQMAHSKTSNLVATAGFKSTKALALGEKDDEILIAYDDCTVQCIDLKANAEKWKFVAKEPSSQDFSCARHIAFSPDRSQMSKPFAVHVPPKRCVLAEDRLRSAHPVTDRLLILYEDTKIVEWNVADDEQLSYDHTAARSMTLSQDGNFLLTSDVNGTLSIWVIPEYRLVYQLKYDELVTDLAFCPDGTRFYDLRGSFCNIWEPETLIRADEVDQDDMPSTYETIMSEPVIANDDNSRVPITSLACGSHERAYCVGKEDGSVTMYNMPSGQKIRKIVAHSTSVSVIKLVWSPSEKYLASVDDSGRVIVKRLEAPTAEKDRWAIFPLNICSRH